MIKFEHDNKIAFFKDAEAVLEWLIENYHKGNEYDLLSEYSCCFPAWVNQNYNAMEILLDPEYYTYNYLYELWEEEVISDIDSGWFDELQPMEDSEND